MSQEPRQKRLGMKKWKNGKMKEWKNGRMEEWKNGRMTLLESKLTN